MLAAMAFAAQAGAAEPSARPRTANEIEANVARLLQSDELYAYFIIRVAGTSEFLQFNGFAGSPSLDFPIVSREQKKSRRKIKKAAKEIGLKCAHDKGAAIEMIECPLPASAKEIAQIAQAFLSQAYGVPPDASLSFEANGFDLIDE